MEVMGHVMQEVLAESLQGEYRAVGPTPGALPVALAQRVEGGGGLRRC